MYKLERNPARGEVRISSKTYHVAQCSGDGTPEGITDMLKDICHVLFDGLINLRPIADHSACALYAANYREFLSCSLEGGHENSIQTHCWHICTPRASSWNDDDPPKPFHPNDTEDLEKTPKQKKTIEDSRFPINEEGCVIPVTEEAYDYSKLNDAFIQYITPIRSIRQSNGDPLNATRETLNLDEDASSKRINAHLATLETSRYLAAFSERAHRNELAVFDQSFSETIQNMSLCGRIPAPEDLLQAEKEEQEEEEGEEN